MGEAAFSAFAVVFFLAFLGESANSLSSASSSFSIVDTFFDSRRFLFGDLDFRGDDKNALRLPPRLPSLCIFFELSDSLFFFRFLGLFLGLLAAATVGDVAAASAAWLSITSGCCFVLSGSDTSCCATFLVATGRRPARRCRTGGVHGPSNGESLVAQELLLLVSPLE